MNQQNIANLLRALAAEFDGSAPAPVGTGGSVGGFPAPGPAPTPQPTPTPQPGTSGDIPILRFDWAAPSPRQYCAAPIFAVAFTTDNTDLKGMPARVTAAQWQDAQSDMTAVLAEAPGDFDHAIASFGPTVSLEAPFHVGAPGPNDNYVVLERNHTYYVNIRNPEQRNKAVDLLRPYAGL